MDCIVRGVAKSQTRLSSFHFHTTFASYPRHHFMASHSDLLTTTNVFADSTPSFRENKQVTGGHRVKPGSSNIRLCWIRV